MRKSAIISAAVLLTCLLLACACSQNNQQEAERAEISTAPLSFEAQNFKKQSPNCKSDTVSCATVQASYLLAVGGQKGTLKNSYKNDPPYIFGKTGSLNNNHVLSGYLITRKGKLLIFSLMNNNYLAPTNDVRKHMQEILYTIYTKY